MSCIIKNGKYYDSKGVESKLYKDLAEKVGEQEAHSLFVLSHTDTFKKEVQNKTKETVKDLIPKGTNFKETIVNGIRTFHISINENKVGRIQLKKYKEGFKVKSTLVNEDMKGKGFGKALYAYAVYRLSNEGATLYTDTFRTEDADRVWERLQKQDLTEDGKTIPPISSIFTPNGEPKAEVVLKYSQDNFSLVEPLTQEEILDISTLQIKDVETSDELYDVLYDTFYKNGIFEPQLKKMQKIYTEEEIRTILEDVEIQARIKETVEKLRHIEEFNITQIEYDKDFSYKDLVINIIGQYKSNNPLQDKQIHEQKNGGEGFVEVEVVDEEGKPIQEKLIYENAVKVIKDPKIIDAVQAVVNAPQVVDTSKVENKVQKWLLDYGLNIKNLAREKYQTLLDFIKTPNDENTILSLEMSLGFERSPRKDFIKITPENRTYQTLKTTKTEQELFDELSLIKTNTPNVYQKVNKIDEQEIRDAVDNQDLTVPVYELYREYFDYGQLNLKNEESRIKYYNNLGWNVKNEDNIIFRSGNLVTKAEDAFTMRGSRGSGHFGTGFYFFGDIQRADEYDKRGVSILNTEGYNLIRIKNYENGLDLHQALKEVNNFYYQNNLEAIAFEVRDTFELPFFEFKNKVNFQKLDNYLLNNQDIIDFLTDKIAKADVKVFDNNRELTNEILTVYKNEYENKANTLYKSLEKTVAKLQNSLLRLGITTDKTALIKKVQNYNLDEYSETSKGKDTLGTEIIKDLGYEGIFVKGLPELDNSLYGNVIFDVKDNTSFSTENVKIEKINTNIETDIDYLTDVFVADFGAEKLKNPNNEFYQQFKITENGIELISNDELTLAKVKSQINNYPKLADYSLISKMLPNLKDAAKTFETKDDRRVQAINNKQSIPSPKTEVEIIDDQFIKAPNETAEWIKIGEDVYEQIEEGVYSKLDFTEDANYYTFNVEAPPYKVFEQKETKVAEKTIKKLTDKKTDSENFDCL